MVTSQVKVSAHGCNPPPQEKAYDSNYNQNIKTDSAIKVNESQMPNRM